MIFGHQGDVFFRQVSNDTNNLKLGEPLKADESGGITIVEGELTGHHHQFRKMKDVTVYPVLEAQERGVKTFLVDIKKDTLLEHFNVKTKNLTNEHTSISFPKGKYLIGTQRQMAANREIERALD